MVALLALSLLLSAPVTPYQEVMRLDDVGTYTVGWVYRGQAPRTFAEGWTGGFDDATGVAYQGLGRVNGREATLLHCPWRGGTGVAFQEYRVALPAGRKAELKGATAMRADAVGKSDGATFRLFVNGQKLLDVNRSDAAWQDFDFDLSRWAGREVTLRFETDPGPEDNPGFDFSLWGDRKLVVRGLPKAAALSLSIVEPDLKRLAPSRNGGVVPRMGGDVSHKVSVQGDSATLTCASTKRLMTYRWSLPKAGGGPLGEIVAEAKPGTSVASKVSVARGARVEWTSAAERLSNHMVKLPDGAPTLVSKYRVGGQVATLKVVGRVVEGSLVLETSCDKPVVKSIDFGGFGPTMFRKVVVTPYYSGRVDYLPKEGLFVNAFLDWTGSNASSHDNAKATYGALTDGSRNVLRETAVYAAAWSLPEVLPNIPNPPSDAASVGKRTVLDVWGGRYVDIAQRLEALHAAGVRGAAVLIHVWQRDGYDNGLPNHYPAMAALGGDEGMKTLGATARRLGFLPALHENYVDYYPNCDRFDEKDVSLDSFGQRVLAWFNPGTGVQSFAVQPNAILPLARTQSPEIHRRYGTTANYLDVHSAVPPWFHVDFRAGMPGAGTFRRVWEAHRDLWAYERETHGGPVFGEGNNHWYWSGLLDGVEAQFGVGWPANAGMEAPLAVDFDLLKIHPLQANHGMGYYERWWDKPDWDGLPPMAILDRYRVQEVAYGHVPFLAAATWSTVSLAWLEHHLLSPVASRYAGQRVAEIAYEVGGKMVGLSAAAVAGEQRRVRVRYQNGLTVWANGSETDWVVAGHVLPPNGWWAEGAGVRAGTTTLGGSWGDVADSGDSLFANARAAADWDSSGVRQVRPSVANFEQTGPRRFRVTYAWLAKEALGRDYTSFVHFTHAGPEGGEEGIRFQQDHRPSAPTSGWRAGGRVADGPYDVALPDGLADGDYDWMIGLYGEDEGRLHLLGVTDGRGRVRLGALQVRDGGKSLSFAPQAGDGEPKSALYRKNLNAIRRVLDFGDVRTDGSVLVRREGDEWVLRAMPRERAFSVELRTSRFGRPGSVRCVGGSSSTVTPEARGAFWRLPMNGAAEYRWPAHATRK